MTEHILEMSADEIIQFIASAPKKTPVRLYVREKPDAALTWGSAHVYGTPEGRFIIGDWNELSSLLEQYAQDIVYFDVEAYARNSAIPLLDMKSLNVRIEPGALIRDHVQLEEGAVIMMGAIINIGAKVGAHTMIDMGAVLGGRARVGARCHVGAGAVLAGVIEPASACPVLVEDDVLIGANAVLLEGVHVGARAVVAAGAIVVEDVPEDAVVAGAPARLIKMRDAKTDSKTGLEEALRTL